MGANYVEEIIEENCDRATLSSRFQRIVEEAQFNEGHDAYSGGLGTKDPSDLVFAPQSFSSYDEASDWIQKNADKWGPALAAFVDVASAKGGSIPTTIKQAEREIKRTIAAAARLVDGPWHKEATRFNEKLKAFFALKDGFISAFNDAAKKKKLISCRTCGSKIPSAKVNYQHDARPRALPTTLELNRRFYADFFYLRNGIKESLPVCQVCEAPLLTATQLARLNKGLEQLLLTAKAAEKTLEKFRAIEARLWELKSCEVQLKQGEKPNLNFWVIGASCPS